MSLFNTIASSAVGKRKSNTTGAIVNGSVIPAESADNYADTETDVAETTQNKTYWDMLVDLCDPLKIDLQFFVWIDTCFVTSVPREETAKLVIDDRENVVKDSVSITSGTETYTRKEDEETTTTIEGGTGTSGVETAASSGVTSKTEIPNVIIVNYGQKALPQVAESRDEDAIQMAGREIIQYHDKYDLNAEQAQSFADKTLNKLQRENGFNVDITVIGHPEYFVGRWVNTNLTRYNFKDRLYIKVMNFSLAAGEAPRNDLNLVKWYPLIEPSRESSSSSGSGDMSTLDEIGREEAKFGSVQNVCSRSSCYIRYKTGDCWADSEWLYDKLNNAGIPARIMGNRGGSYPRHTWIEINMGSGWQTYPYSKYGSRHVGIPSGVGRVFVLIKEGNPPAHISGV